MQEYSFRAEIKHCFISSSLLLLYIILLI